MKVYTIDCPPGMLHARKTRKRFTSVSAFDGYIAQLRSVGRVVEFSSPTHAVLSPLTVQQSGTLFLLLDADLSELKGGQAERRTPEGSEVLA